MKVLSKDEVVAWIGKRTEVVVAEKGFQFSPPGQNALHFHYPTGEGQLVYFARALTTLHHDEATFAGALVWMTEWGVWSEWTEDVGYQAVAMLRGDSEATANFMEAPGQLFNETELLQSAIFLLQPILFGWDAYYCPLFKDCPADFILKISHDAYVDVIPADARSRALIEKFFAGTTFREAECRRS